MRARISGDWPRWKKVTSSLTTRRRSIMASVSLFATLARRMLSASARRSVAPSSCRLSMEINSAFGEHRVALKCTMAVRAMMRQATVSLRLTWLR